MKFLLTIFCVLTTFYSFAQDIKIYPIETVLQGDSVIIITTKQARKTNELLDRQSRDIRIAKKKIQELESIIVQNQSEIKRLNNNIFNDSLKYKNILDTTVHSKNKVIDSAIHKINLIEDWLCETSVGNGYIFYDWTDSLIKVVDLTLYGGEINDLSGNIIFTKRGDNKEYPEYRRVTWQFPESPTKAWDKVNYKELEPIIYPYLYRFKMKTPLLEYLYKNPYVKNEK